MDNSELTFVITTQSIVNLAVSYYFCAISSLDKFVQEIMSVTWRCPLFGVLFHSLHGILYTYLFHNYISQVITSVHYSA